MPDAHKPGTEDGGGRLDRIEHILELVAQNQLAMQEHHDEEFKRLMTWQVLTQDQIEKLTAKVDRLADMQGALDARVDKLVSAIGEFIRGATNQEKRSM